LLKERVLERFILTGEYFRNMIVENIGEIPPSQADHGEKQSVHAASTIEAQQ